MPSPRFANFAYSKTAANITNVQTTVAVTAGQGARFPAGSFWVALSNASGNFELLWCSSRSGDTLTVTRAQRGTTGFAFAAGSDVAHGDFAHISQETADLVIRAIMEVP